MTLKIYIPKDWKKQIWTLKHDNITIKQVVYVPPLKEKEDEKK